MKLFDRRSRAAAVLAGYASGPGATRHARDVALARAQDARMVVLVEGISDLMALDAVGECQERDLAAEGVVVVPVGGAHAFEKHIKRIGDLGIEVRGLVDEAEEGILLRAMATAGIVDAVTGSDPASRGVFVCHEDLEEELIRAVTPHRVEAILEREGDLRSFRSLQRQPAWRDRDLIGQMRRFMGAGARRKLRYARLFALELDPEEIPRPLVDALKL